MPESIRATIYNKIRNDITQGKLSPGERLIESKLADEFKSSRGPIREALLQLVSEGFLILQRNIGISVPKLSLKQIDEIYSLRSLLESYAVRLTAAKIDNVGLSRLKEYHQNLVIASETKSLADWVNNNISFHNFFIENSENDHLIQMLDSLRRKTYRYSVITITKHGAIELFLEDHQNIIRACEKCQYELAEKCMHTHMERTKTILLKHLNEFSLLSF